MKSFTGRKTDLQDNLIKACRRKDRRAQLEVYNRYSKAMYNVCLNIVRNDFQAEEIMHEAFISAFLNIESFSGKVSFGAWLKRIVINKCIDHLRKKKISFEDIDNYPDLTDYSNVNDELFYEQTQESIISEINNLAEGYRTILSLHLFEGYNHDEIAQILGISSSTSRSQYSRAKALLIKKIKAKDL